jgi:hypothetical protein
MTKEMKSYFLGFLTMLIIVAIENLIGASWLYYIICVLLGLLGFFLINMIEESE